MDTMLHTVNAKEDETGNSFEIQTGSIETPQDLQESMHAIRPYEPFDHGKNLSKLNEGSLNAKLLLLKIVNENLKDFGSIWPRPGTSTYES